MIVINSKNHGRIKFFDTQVLRGRFVWCEVGDKVLQADIGEVPNSENYTALCKKWWKNYQQRNKNSGRK